MTVTYIYSMLMSGPQTMTQTGTVQFSTGPKFDKIVKRKFWPWSQIPKMEKKSWLIDKSISYDTKEFVVWTFQRNYFVSGQPLSLSDGSFCKFCVEFCGSTKEFIFHIPSRFEVVSMMGRKGEERRQSRKCWTLGKLSSDHSKVSLSKILRASA